MKAVSYQRVSSEEQASGGHSLEMQKEKIKAFCTFKGWDLVTSFEDAGKSAKDLNRPALQALLKSWIKPSDDPSRNREPRAIVIWKLDRLFRNTMDALELSETLRQHDIELVSVCESIDTSTAMGRFFFTLMAGLAALEREQTSERTKVVAAKLRLSGKKYGPAPFGFKEGEGKTLVVDSAESAVVEQILSLRRENKSFHHIARHLNSNRIPAANRSGSTSGKWFASSVRDIYLRRRNGTRGGRH